jgi:hypothetical protein
MKKQYEGFTQVDFNEEFARIHQKTAGAKPGLKEENMYRRDAKGRLKHLDFIVLDLLVLQISFVMSYMLHHA